METTDTLRGLRRALVTAAHHFLLCVLPFRAPESHHALETFVAEVQGLHVPWFDVDAVILQCLAVLNNHTGSRLPSLVDRYLSSGLGRPDRMTRFATCVQDVLTYEGVGNGLVQQAIEIVRAECDDSKLTPRSVAGRLNVGLPILCVAFRRHTGLKMGEYIRDARLQRAAALLLTTSLTIKEVWVAAGYNHASNFTHDFKRRFDVTPSLYRQRGIRRAAQEDYRVPAPARPAGEPDDVPRPTGTSVLIAGDACIRQVIGATLARDGFAVTLASTAEATVAAVEQHAPRVILLDDRLDEVDGLDVVRAIRERCDASQPVVILFSSDYDFFARSEETVQLDARLVSKLCDLDDVRRVIDWASAAPAQREARRGMLKVDDHERARGVPAYWGRRTETSVA